MNNEFRDNVTLADEFENWLDKNYPTGDYIWNGNASTSGLLLDFLNEKYGEDN